MASRLHAWGPPARGGTLPRQQPPNSGWAGRRASADWAGRGRVRAGGTVKPGVSSKAARPANEALVKKGSTVRSRPTPFSGLNVLIALDAWTVLLAPTRSGGSLAWEGARFGDLRRYQRWAGGPVPFYPRRCGTPLCPDWWSKGGGCTRPTRSILRKGRRL